MREEGASDQKVSRGHFPSPLVVESLVPLAVDVGGLLLKKEGGNNGGKGPLLYPYMSRACCGAG